MSGRHLIHVVSISVIAMAVALAVTAALTLVWGDGAFMAFFAPALGSGGLGWLAFRRTQLTRDLTIREGYAVVSLSWFAIGVVGAVPYYVSGIVDAPAAALFESVSGFTTTGASVFADVEILPRAILFWRALTHWIGGMGIIVLGVAVLPYLGVGGMQLFEAEVPGPTAERLAPRITQTAKLLWLVYAGLTIVQILLYLFGGMGAFDAVTHAFATMATGGFSTRNASISAYDSAYIDYVTIAFMLLAGMNFALHYRALTGQPRRYLADAEWRTYCVLVIAATALVTSVLFVRGDHVSLGVEKTFRDAFFQVASIITTTGFVSADWELWPHATQLTLFLLMLVGAMAGSTAGGMKVIRFYAIHRHALTWLRRSLHPRAVVLTRIGRKALRDDDLRDIISFVMLYLALFVSGSLVLTLLGHDFLTSIGASASALGNVGPGLNAVGPTDNYGWMGPVSHLVLVFLMLAGRLEIFTVLLLFHPDLWRRR
ncbi:MAG: TrkH family potassium uptake protein [Longimicrobiales bacterium]